MTDSPDEEHLLNHFREWLRETRMQAEELPSTESADELSSELHPVGLYDLVEEFTALRHELKLQTKDSRKLQEQTESMLPTLQQAIDRLDSARSDETAREALRPIVEALADLDEALDRGLQVIENTRHRILEESARELRDSLNDLYHREPWWRRWACHRFYETIQEIWFRQAMESHRSVFDSLIEGYGLIQNRLSRILKEEQIQQISTIGQPVDPNCMTVVDVIRDPERPAGLVVDEVRPGYLWKGKVLRFAEVRAVAQDDRS